MKRVIVLTGGVGGAKLVVGLVELLGADVVTAIVNTGDDFVHLGLSVSPDIDTLCYALAGLDNRELGWGRQEETWNFMAAFASLGGEDWFRLGDGDLALHVFRTRALTMGQTLSDVTAAVVRNWKIGARILPMSDDPVATKIVTRDEGVLPFQRYFVGRRCEPIVQSITFDGAAVARPAPGVIDALLDARNEAILIAPSNPMLSIDPILAVPGIREALQQSPAPVVAVSPLIAGQAVKGPTAKLMAELALDTKAITVADHYGEFLDGFVTDERDEFDAGYSVATVAMDTLMKTASDKRRVAAAALNFAARLTSAK